MGDPAGLPRLKFMSYYPPSGMASDKMSVGFAEAVAVEAAAVTAWG